MAVSGHRAKLYNTSDTADVLLGSSEYTTVSFALTRSIIAGRFTIAGSKTFEVQHYCDVTRSGDGFGVGAPADSNNVIFTICEFWKEA